jgi:hypothetical protein
MWSVFEWLARPSAGQQTRKHHSCCPNCCCSTTWLAASRARRSPLSADVHAGLAAAHVLRAVLRVRCGRRGTTLGCFSTHAHRHTTGGVLLPSSHISISLHLPPSFLHTCGHKEALGASFPLHARGCGAPAGSQAAASQHSCSATHLHNAVGVHAVQAHNQHCRGQKPSGQARLCSRKPGRDTCGHPRRGALHSSAPLEEQVRAASVPQSPADSSAEDSLSGSLKAPGPACTARPCVRQQGPKLPVRPQRCPSLLQPQLPLAHFACS